MPLLTVEYDIHCPAAGNLPRGGAFLFVAGLAARRRGRRKPGRKTRANMAVFPCRETGTLFQRVGAPREQIKNTRHIFQNMCLVF